MTPTPALLKTLEVAGPAIGALILVIFLLFRHIERRDKYFESLDENINSCSKTVERLTVLVELLVHGRMK